MRQPMSNSDPQVLLDTFDGTVAPLRKQIQHNDIQSRTLATLHDTLLPKLLSGEIKATN
jgi:type I restriction enzyme S subunit